MMDIRIDRIKDTEGLYALSGGGFANRYYIVSSPSTSLLMASPEVVGFDCYKAMLSPTTLALKYLRDKTPSALRTVEILTILRGGLNYPIEECCSGLGIQVRDINFLSCERIIKDNVITGLDIKYEKLHTVDASTLVVGDIIASCATLKVCLQHVIERYRKDGRAIRRIVFFTIGGTKALSLMEKMTVEIRAFWPEFEGFDCVFYEGVFAVYEDRGVTGVNVPDIDFGWKGGFVSPDFRRRIMEYSYAPALLEKCIIYDGGARRYNLSEHFAEVLEYWEALLTASATASMADFVEEKLGYDPSIGFKSWTQECHLPYDESYRDLYEMERAYSQKLLSSSLEEICRKRLAQLNNNSL